MMWLFASLLILISVGGSFAEISCIGRERAKCPDHDLKFPETPEEALETCQHMHAYSTCLADGKERCDGDDEEIRAIRQASAYLRSTCQEDNPTFQAISSNFECVKKVVNLVGDFCTDIMSDESEDVLKPHFEPLFEEHQAEIYHCFFHTLEMTCLAVTSEYHCGAEVRDAIEDVLENTIGHFAACPDEFRKELEKPLEVFEAVLVKELELQEAIAEEGNE